MSRFSTLAPFGRAALQLFCTFVLSLSASPTFARQGGHPAPPASPPPASSAPSSSTRTNDTPSAENPWDENELIQRSNTKQGPPTTAGDNCFLPPLNGLFRSTVGVAELQVPAKARREREDACAALTNSKIIDAESHLRQAVKQWPKYSSAWVALGQVLEAQHKMDKAYDACSQPLASDSNYLLAYLCLADISAHSQNWNSVLQLSNRALKIDPTDDAIAYDYNAAANLHLHRLAEAEKGALKAVEIDKSNTDPRVHFLLAQIYEAKGDRENEAAQLREYLKYISSPSDVAMVRSYLSELEKRTK